MPARDYRKLDKQRHKFFYKYINTIEAIRSYVYHKPLFFSACLQTLLIYRFRVLVLSVHIEYTYICFQFLNDVNEDVIKNS